MYKLSVSFTKYGLKYFHDPAVSMQHAQDIFLRAFAKTDRTATTTELKEFLEGKPITHWGRTYQLHGLDPQMELF